MRAGYVTIEGFSDGRVRRVPSASANAVLARFPGTSIAKALPPPSIPQAIDAARPFAADAAMAGGPLASLVGTPMGRSLGKFMTDPQTIAMAATAPMGGAPMLARAGVGALAAGLSAGAEGKNIAGNAMLAGAPEPVGEGIAAGGRATAKMAMKTSLGRAAVGSVEKALKYGLAPTQRFLDFVNNKIGILKDQAVAAANQLEAAGHTATYHDLAGPIKAARARYAAHDITGSATQNALDEVLSEMKNKIGPKTIPESTILAPGRGTVAAVSGPARPATTSPAQPITPTQLQEINQIARQKLNDLFAAKQAKLGVPPDPRELGYMKVWARSKQLLENMGGDVGKSIGKANREMKDLYNMDVLARKAGERAHGLTGIEKAAGLTGAVGGGLAHNPVAAAGSIPLMLALHAATSPEGMAALARGLNGPAGQGLARTIPRFGAVGVGQFLNQ